MFSLFLHLQILHFYGFVFDFMSTQPPEYIFCILLGILGDQFPMQEPLSIGTSHHFGKQAIAKTPCCLQGGEKSKEGEKVSYIGLEVFQ